MRVLVYSDLQLHPYTTYASDSERLYNSRLLDHIEVLNQIHQYAVEHSIDTIVFGGDFFEARGKLDVNAIVLAKQWKMRVAKDNIKQIDIVGNHDLCDKNSTRNALDIFYGINGQTVVADDDVVILPDGSAIYCVPYCYCREDMVRPLSTPPDGNIKSYITLVHYGIFDVPTESGNIIRDIGNDMEGALRLSELQAIIDDERCKVILFGHYHLPQSVTKKVHFIGTPLQHNWGERKVEPCFLDLETTTGEFKRIPTHAPRFVEVNEKSPEKGNIAGNFCRLIIEDNEKKEKAREKLIKLGAQFADVQVQKNQPSSKPQRYNINLTMGFEAMGDEMLSKDETKLDKEKLKSIMREALKSAAEMQ